MSTGHPGRQPHWLYDKAQRQIKRREDLADYERNYREKAGLPEGPLDLPEYVGLQLALKTFELFMDRVFWGEGSGEMTSFLDGGLQRQLLEEYKSSEVAEGWRVLREAAWGADLTWFDDVTDWSGIRVVPRGVPRQEVNLSREAMDLLAGALDTTLEHYGTSEHADPRGFWMKLDVESDQGRTTDT